METLLQKLKQHGLFVIILIFFLVYVLLTQNEKQADSLIPPVDEEDLVSYSPPPQKETSTIPVETQDPVIKVEIKGEVVHPGVYEMKEEQRIEDVVEKAGGLLAEADRNQINMAQKLEDELSIYIPKIGEEVALVSSQSSTSNSSLLNLNKATKEELMNLPGIGPSKAQAILDYRDQNGSFQSIEELKEVRGIGDAIFNQLQPLISIN